jgi:hypothetical protein
MNRQSYERGYTHGLYAPTTKYQKGGYNYYQGFIQGLKASRGANQSVRVIILSALETPTILRKPNGLEKVPDMNKLWKNTFYASIHNRKKPKKQANEGKKTIRGFNLK